MTGEAHELSSGSIAAEVLSNGLLVRASAAWPVIGMPPGLAGMLMSRDILLPACYLYNSNS